MKVQIFLSTNNGTIFIFGYKDICPGRFLSAMEHLEFFDCIGGAKFL